MLGSRMRLCSLSWMVDKCWCIRRYEYGNYMRVLYLAALQQREDSALMRHELAYILGQMQNRKACDVLSKILRDESDDVLVRHEVS